MSKNITRRGFLKEMGVVGGAAAMSSILSGCSKSNAGTNIPEKWDREIDVLVVGFGVAGASAALNAKKAGADVLVMEKMPEGQDGGNSRVSGNMIFIPLDPKDCATYFKGMSKGHEFDVTDELANVYGQELYNNEAWLTDELGVKLVEYPLPMTEVPWAEGSETVKFYMINGTPGNAALWLPITEEVKAQRIDILYETQAKKLVIDADGAVIGLIAENGGSELSIRTKKGVVLAMGGFEFNDKLKGNYLAAPCYSYGSPGNTGDGIAMCQAIGADLWHMNNKMGPISMGFLTEDLGPEMAKSPVWLTYGAKSYFFVDKYGKRFMNEKRESQHGHGWHAVDYYDGNVGEYPRIPCWIVFDEAVRTAGPLQTPMKFTWWGWFSGYEWSSDNSAEVEKGWIQQGTTIEELAGKIDVDPEALKSSLEKFNGIAAGEDDEFGRSAEVAIPLEGPFYAIQGWPSMVNTQGGPRRDHMSRVIHADGNPIPHLYSAGEFGSVYAWMYQGGGNIAECLAFGRVAGTNAAAEESI